MVEEEKYLGIINGEKKTFSVYDLTFDHMVQLSLLPLFLWGAGFYINLLGNTVA